MDKDQLNIFDDDKHFENKKEIKKGKLEKDLNKEPFKINLLKLITSFIDYRNINGIKYLSENINENNKNNKVDVIFELYNNNLLTPERLSFLMKTCNKYFNVSSNLVKSLIEEEKVSLLDIIFNSLKFYDNEIILRLLLHYKNKISLSTFDLNQQISNEKFKISIKFPHFHFYNTIFKYINNECDKDDINIYIIKYLVEHGIDINEKDRNDKTPLFKACKRGDEDMVKYLVEHGVDINNKSRRGETPLFKVCKYGNETIVK